METSLVKIAIRNQALFLKGVEKPKKHELLHPTTLQLLANCKKLGYGFSEDLLQTLNQVSPKTKLNILEVLKDITGVKKNWTPLVKGWDIPTQESYSDHLITFFNIFNGVKKGTTLPCQHIIPRNTFPLERYNGCPYCGTPFEISEIKYYGQGNKLTILDLWTETEMKAYFCELLSSKIVLDATQIDSLVILLSHYMVPEGLEILVKETTMLAIRAYVEKGKSAQAGRWFKNPNDILRYLWYDKTGFLQIIKPRTIIERSKQNASHLNPILDKGKQAKTGTKQSLKLKYTRAEGRRVATWMNELDISAQAACEIMHPKRSMWIRFIRALRLVEYSKKKGFAKLAEILDKFHREDYVVYQSRINAYRMKQDADKTFALLKKRPGLFARSLFSNMLWFGQEQTLAAFREVLEEIPSRLLLTLNMYAETYFDPTLERSVKPLGGTQKRIPANQLLTLYPQEELSSMKANIEDLCLEAMFQRFEKVETENESLFIEESLYRIPIAIGDRSENIQDMPSAIMGTRFPVEGSKVRLFMQWGEGLKAQHLDMDLSCKVAFQDKMEYCSYSRLVSTGCKHSGDIQRIPNKVGTAEYIELDLDTLTNHGAQYVSFTCNAYSAGSITPNLVVGWMNSKHHMRISEKTGVAYDPSCVQHQVRIGQGLGKGLLFGVLDVLAREIVWLEMNFGGQVVQNLDLKTVKTLLAKLDSKLTIGKVLELKALAQNLELLEKPTEADEVYDLAWAANTAEVMNTLVI